MMRFRFLLPAVALAALAACGGQSPKEVRNGAREPRPIGPPEAAPPAAEGTLAGRLTDRATSHPLAGALVLAQSAEGTRVLATARTGADGAYTLAKLPHGAPLRVVSQPVTGAVAYGTEVSAPVTLVKGRTPGAVDLAFTAVALPGAVEGRLQGGFGGSGMLLQVCEVDGHKVQAVVRPHHPAPFRFEAVPPGAYLLAQQVLLPATTQPTQPGVPTRRVPRLHRELRPIMVTPGGTAHVELGLPQGAPRG